MYYSEENYFAISRLLLQLVMKLIAHDKKVRYYGTDQQLFEAEIHMIVAIKDSRPIHVTGLAEKLGITKGAVSQIINKLNNKGMVAKDEDPDNKSKVVLRLTQKGEIAYWHHNLLHQKFDEIIDNLLSDESEGNKEFLKRFLISLHAEIDDLKV